MDLLIQLFSNWIGILSFAVVAFIIGMAAYMYWWVGKNVKKATKGKN